MIHQTKQRTYRFSHARPRQGAVLIVILLVVAALALAAYTYSETMLTEYRALHAATDRMQIDSACESGIEMIKQNLNERRTGKTIGLSDQTNPLTWNTSSERRFTLHFTGRSWQANDVYGHSRGGSQPLMLMLNESCKLNVNGLDLAKEQVEQSRLRLMALPGMTPAIADAVLDWIDEDDEARPFGVEASGYAAAGLPYMPRNAPLHSLDELLLVRGVNGQWLFGEDFNGNGWLDPAEDDGAISLPPDNQDGILETGVSRWLTVSGAESNYDDRGIKRFM